MDVKAKLYGYAQLMRLDRPIGIYLLLWPTLWGLLLAAGGMPPWDIGAVFVLGVAIMRSAGCVINDFADRNLDGAVERTASRPLVSGLVSAAEALWLFAGLLSLAFVLVLTLNWQTIALSFVAVALAATYPFMKRVTYLPQFVLGAAYSFGIPMAFMAVQQHIPWWAWLLYVTNLLWTVAYDTEYAMVDRNDDVKAGIKSTAILFGQYDRLIIAILQILSLGLLTFIGSYLSLSWPYFAGLLVAAGLFAYHQWLIRERTRSECFKAFLHNHYVGMIITLGLAGHFVI